MFEIQYREKKGDIVTVQKVHDIAIYDGRADAEGDPPVFDSEWLEDKDARLLIFDVNNIDIGIMVLTSMKPKKAEEAS